MNTKSGIAIWFGRFVLCGTLAFLLTGCGDTSQSPEDPTILGVPPSTAYLGVDYNYNFGADGGDDLLNFSLSNAPSWMALENTTNKARPGIVLRGVPGVTGGRRGESDLGRAENIRITGTDSNLLGDSGFEVEVRHNALEVVSTTFREGQAGIPDVNENDEAVCEFPDMEETHLMEVTHRNLAVGPDDDEFVTATREYRAYPALIEVRLNQPSVEPVKVRFRVSEDDPRTLPGDDFDDCIGGEDGRCEYTRRNRGKALYGEDFVLNSGAFSDPPDYLQYLDVTPPDEDHEGGEGLLTFEPGVTTCFIRVEIFDDSLAEDTEFFDVELLEVTEGIASLDQDGAVDSTRIDIADNSPQVSLEPEEVVVSRGSSRTFTARLDRPNDSGETLVAAIEQEDFEEEERREDVILNGQQYGELPLIIEFPPGEQEVEVNLEVDDSGDPATGGPLEEDLRFRIFVDADRQFGRELFVRGQDVESDVYINEWTDEIALPFSPSSAAVGLFGEFYIAGTDGDDVVLRSFNRLGDTDDSVQDTAWLIAPGSSEFDNGDADSAPRVIFLDRNTGTRQEPERSRFLGLGYTNSSTNIQLARFISIIDEDEEDGGDDVDMAVQWNFSPTPLGTGETILKGLGMGRSGELFLGAETTGTWSTPEGEKSAAGEFDVLVGRVSTQTEEDDSVAPNIDWVNLFGTPLQETVAGISVTSGGELTVYGSTLGDLVSDTARGGEDFIHGLMTEDGIVNRERQFGSNENDRFTHVAPAFNRIWVGGTGEAVYEEGQFSNISEDSERTQSNDRDNPFVFLVSSSGVVQNILNLGELDSSPAAVELTAMASEGNTVLVGGRSSVGSGAFIALLELDSINDEISEEWRIAVEDAESIRSLAFHEGRKIFAVMQASDGSYPIRLFNRQGDQLTE